MKSIKRELSKQSFKSKRRKTAFKTDEDPYLKRYGLKGDSSRRFDTFGPILSLAIASGSTIFAQAEAASQLLHGEERYIALDSEEDKTEIISHLTYGVPLTSICWLILFFFRSNLVEPDYFNAWLLKGIYIVRKHERWRAKLLVSYLLFAIFGILKISMAIWLLVRCESSSSSEAEYDEYEFTPSAQCHGIDTLGLLYSPIVSLYTLYETYHADYGPSVDCFIRERGAEGRDKIADLTVVTYVNQYPWIIWGWETDEGKELRMKYADTYGYCKLDADARKIRSAAGELNLCMCMSLVFLIVASVLNIREEKKGPGWWVCTGISILAFISGFCRIANTLMCKDDKIISDGTFLKITPLFASSKTSIVPAST